VNILVVLAHQDPSRMTRSTAEGSIRRR
jgi:hypothetical protein